MLRVKLLVGLHAKIVARMMLRVLKVRFFNHCLPFGWEEFLSATHSESF